MPNKPWRRSRLSLAWRIVERHGGRIEVTGDIAELEKVNITHVRRLLRLVLLAPNVIEAIMAADGKGVTLESLLRQSLPVDWLAQTNALCQ